MTGSVADFQRLICTLERYQLADSTADLLCSREGYLNSHQFYFPLIAAARNCGWSACGSETAYAFARRKVESFRTWFPKHAEDALVMLSRKV